VGRPVMTLAPFMLAPDANALLETGCWCGGWCCWTWAGSCTGGAGAAAAGALDSAAAAGSSGLVVPAKAKENGMHKRKSDRRG
jgi:hypothetical protein